MHRPTVGIIAVVLLVAAAVLYFSPEGTFGESTNTEPLLAACMRIGALMAVLWLALPDTRETSSLLFLVAMILIAVTLALRPRYAPFVIGGLLIYAVLRPRRRRVPAGEAKRN